MKTRIFLRTELEVEQSQCRERVRRWTVMDFLYPPFPPPLLPPPAPHPLFLPPPQPSSHPTRHLLPLTPLPYSHQTKVSPQHLVSGGGVFNPDGRVYDWFHGVGGRGETRGGGSGETGRQALVGEPNSCRIIDFQNRKLAIALKRHFSVLLP